LIHFYKSFCRKRAAYAVSKAAEDVPDVLEWNDSLLRISSVIKLSEILDDWATDEETDIERVPWRFKVPVEPVRNYSDFYEHSENLLNNDNTYLNSLYEDKGISESAEFYVFGNTYVTDTNDYNVLEDLSDITQHDLDSIPVVIAGHSESAVTSEVIGEVNLDVAEILSRSPTITLDETSSVCRENNQTADNSKLILSSNSGDCKSKPLVQVDPLCIANSEKRSSKRKVSSTSFKESKKRKKDLENSWSNNKREYTLKAKNWRVISNHDEFVDYGSDNTFLEVSDSEEGADILELPVVEEEEPFEEDVRSILFDPDFQVFNETISQENPFIEELDSILALESGTTTPCEDLSKITSEIFSDTDLVIENILRTNCGVDYNFNEDEFLSDLLIDFE